ncbi:uncharacterized protein K452DRAFT_238657 [Aplosporella prunicola CBS 121167]|uniref:Uncharacterized protein n=1 Tax=Aplosporella prunicola CBS 121167 TaxID=1176127 RepID=A0A6A6AZB8_9PEZI|nr:uncharacterized protein K452DRAFT_238657 [Aplosporella prunicola CBS 121167]KAF2135811.1 hypothetical protein K452DRAFT_238657 [Aplosporella prunicola CBS 121167]
MGGPAHDGRFRGKTIKGVKVNCDGDVRLLGTTTYEAVDVPPTHPIFYDHDEPSIAKHIGLSVLTRKCEPNPIWAKGSSMGFYDNQPVTFLHMDCDLNTMSVPGWGWAPNKWQNKVGSVLIVRKDCKPLLPLHAAALCNYCQTYLQPRFEKAVEATGPNMMATRTNFLARITRENFELCWKETLENKDVYGSNMDAPNPYDVD